MKIATIILLSIIAYGIYCVANGGNDVFTLFWSFVASL